MKIYLIKKDNCETYEDYYEWISNAFTTFRGASQLLIDQGFEVYYHTFNGKGDIRFLWQESEEYMSRCKGARIIEIEVEEYDKI